MMVRIFKLAYPCVLSLLLISFRLEAEHCPFIIFSPPKCGTHLNAKILSQICEKPATIVLSEMGPTIDHVVQVVEQATASGSFMVAHHFKASVLEILIQKGYKIIFTVRDPRDQLISVMNWMREGQWFWLPVSKIQNPEMQIEELITGARLGWACFPKCFLHYEYALKSVPSDLLYRSKFEHLVGPRGGGSEEDQIETIYNLAMFLGIEMPIEKAEAIAKTAFGNSRTFRNGQIGSWKSHFTDLHKTLFKVLYQSDLVRLGYEQNENW